MGYNLSIMNIKGNLPITDRLPCQILDGLYRRQVLRLNDPEIIEGSTKASSRHGRAIVLHYE